MEKIRRDSEDVTIMPWEPKYTNEELAAKIVELAAQDPKLGWSGVCTKLGVGRKYIWNRAEASQIVKDMKELCEEIFERGWVDFGIEGMPMGKDFNSQLYGWVTRNVLRTWREEKGSKKEIEVESQVIEPFVIEYDATETA